MLSKSNLFLVFLCILVLIRWYFFGTLWLFEENITLLQPMQDYLVTVCKQLMPEPQSSLLSGILIGVKQDMDQNFKNALTNTATIHMVVVSGQNLSMLAGFLLAFSPFFGRKKTISGTIGILLGYSVLTGLQIPVIRAAFMSIFTLIGLLFNREVNALKILIFSLFLMLLVNPTWLGSISFQLSFLATVGVMVIAPEFDKADKWLPEFIKMDLWVSLSAQLITTPIIAINFHRLSIVGLLSNMLVLWTIAPVMITGIIALAAFFISPTLAAILAMFPNFLLFYFVKVINLTNQEWASVLISDFPVHFWAGYYLLLIGIYSFFKAKNQKTQSKNIEKPRVLTSQGLEFKI